MSREKRLVLDTNLPVSGMLFLSSTPRQAVVKTHNEAIPMASDSTLAELLEVFLRPKFDRAARLELGEALVREHVQRCRIVTPQQYLAKD